MQVNGENGTLGELLSYATDFASEDSRDWAHASAPFTSRRLPKVVPLGEIAEIAHSRQCEDAPLRNRRTAFQADLICRGQMFFR